MLEMFPLTYAHDEMRNLAINKKHSQSDVPSLVKNESGINQL